MVIRKLYLMTWVGFLLTFFPPTHYASAHPLGNFSVNRYSRLELSQIFIRTHYVVDMAEVPALQEREVIDSDRDGTVSNEEHNLYLKIKAEKLSEGLHLTINGNSASLRTISKELSFPPGQGGLPTQRLSLTMEAPVPPFTQGNPWVLDYNDHNYSGRLGWKEIIVQPLPGVDLLESNIPNQDQSDALREYPEELLNTPLDIQNARLRFVPDENAAAAPEKKAARPGTIIKAENRFSKLITTQDLTLPVMLYAFFTALGLGALHSLSPGHGKTIVAAYLVGSRGTPKHAFFLGAVVTLTHTIGVFALGLVTLFASRYILPQQLYPWLSALSGIIVVLIGATLFTRRLSFLLNGNTHSHHHGHTHLIDKEHDGHVHDHRHFDEHVSHSHPHGCDHSSHSHLHDFRSTEKDVSVSHKHDNSPHHHGHSHLPPGMDGSPVSLRSLLALGISGGILPCPSALVVLLGAISLHRVGFGLVLIIAFSIGLAGVLTGIGLVFLKGRQIISRFGLTNPLFRFLPVGSAAFIAILGAGITLNALRQFAI